MSEEQGSEDTRETLTAFVARVGLKFKATFLVKDFPAWPLASHWRCTLSCGGERMGIVFHMGSAHTSPPKVEDVLDCLASDVSGLENVGSFGEWCADYGYDTDSRKAFKTYRAIEKQADRLKTLLSDEYETLLWKTERL